MLGLCQHGGCCIAPLLFFREGRGQGDDDQLSQEDQLDNGHVEKSQESRLVEEVSVWRRECAADPQTDTERGYSDQVLKLLLPAFTPQVTWLILVLFCLYSHCVCFYLPFAVLFAAGDGWNHVGGVQSFYCHLSSLKRSCWHVFIFCVIPSFNTSKPLKM